MDAAQIMQLLPHRYPMLLVDRVIEVVDGERIVGIKNVTINEPFFQGHFPGHPIMPGVLIVEAMAQVGSNATVTVVELLGLGAGLNNYELLSAAVDLNPFCTGLDGQMVDDMQSLDRFNDPETGDLLEVLYEILEALYGPGTSRVPGVFGSEKNHACFLRAAATAPSMPLTREKPFLSTSSVRPRYGLPAAKSIIP